MLAHTKPLSRYWLILGVIALAVAGLFSLVLVVARTPGVSEIPVFKALFHQALVVHVDLSVLMWFLSMACLLWSLMAAPSRPPLPMLEEAALASFGLGMLALTCSPLNTGAEPLMSNYIPVLMGPLFFLGLSLIFCGVALQLVRLFTARQWSKEIDWPLQFTLFAAGLIALMAGAAFFWSGAQMPQVIEGTQYYEMLFWGGGHVLQLLHVQVLLVCWVLMARAVCSHFSLDAHKYVFKVLASTGIATALLTPLAYMLYEVTSAEHRSFFTQGMIMAGGVAPGLLALMLLPLLWKRREARKGPLKALWSCLLMSVLLFLYGGFLGSMIRDQNVVIPAHYHGSIVGVTLGFMGAAYLLLPRLGYVNVAGWRMAYWQPIVYGLGQALHISGLGWSGGYGVLRKTPGGMANLPFDVKMAMGFMGLGGLIAIIGGLLFVVVMAKAMLRKPAQA